MYARLIGVSAEDAFGIGGNTKATIACTRESDYCKGEREHESAVEEIAGLIPGDDLALVAIDRRLAANATDLAPH